MPTAWATFLSFISHWLQCFHFIGGRLYPRLSVPQVDLTGKNAIVTGANSGIGLEIARTLASLGAQVTLACRNLSKAQQAKTSLGSLGEKVDCMLLDCASLVSVDQFLRQWGDTPLSILVNAGDQNAGGAPSRLELSKDGFEKSYMVNILSHVQLTLGLLPFMTSDARIVETSSWASSVPKAWHVNSEDQDFTTKLSRMGYKLHDSFSPSFTLFIYGRSKLLQIVFAKALQKWLDNHDEYKMKNIKINAYHPGCVATPIWTGEGWSVDPKAIFRRMVQFFTSARGVGISPEQGAIPAVWLASEAETEGGGYYMRKTRLQAAPVASELKRINDFWDAWFSLYEKRKKSS